uniref:Nucleolar protein 56 n=1 Tax=Euplotes crassus TaxID=5936 RepID=A0A7S3KHU6_EUPCR
MKAYQPFKTAEEALKNIFAISKGEVTETLQEFLESYLPKVKSKKKQKFQLGIADKIIGPQISEKTGYTTSTNETIREIFRGIRTHFNRFSKKITESDIKQAQLGLAHAFSRNKVQHDVNRQDKPIIQVIALIEQMDKNINTFAMRLKEWFSWHFPELAKIVTDNSIYAQLVHLIENRENINEALLPKLEEITLDEEKAKEIIEANNASMGQDISENDTAQIKMFSSRIVEMANYRTSLGEYLHNRMLNVAPNLSALIGDNVGAKLISQAGSLVNLAKYPASTIQILGAEKALFRSLKSGGNTPKYGIIYNSSFISRAGIKNKGKISRYIANKLAIAARFDQFALIPNTKMGEALKEQVEERLRFFASGDKPKTNRDVMASVLEELKADGLYATAEETAKEEADQSEEEEAPKKKSKKDKKEKKSKKSKKRKHSEMEEQDVEAKDTSEKKKKKKKSKKAKVDDEE